MKEEISKILKMMQEGKIDLDKAAELIDALKGQEQPKMQIPKSESEEYLRKNLKIKVLSEDGDKINLNIPVKTIKSVDGALDKIIGINGNGQLRGIDMNMVASAIREGAEGTIVDIEDEDGNSIEIAIA